MASSLRLAQVFQGCKDTALFDQAASGKVGKKKTIANDNMNHACVRVPIDFICVFCVVSVFYMSTSVSMKYEILKRAVPWSSS